MSLRLTVIGLAVASLVAIGVFLSVRDKGIEAGSVPEPVVSQDAKVEPSVLRRLHFDVLEGTGEGAPLRDLELVRRAMGVYQNLVRDGGSLSMPPAASNRELTRALIGQNRAHLAVVPPDHSTVGVGGELLDRWGTPYEFHPVSSRSVGIRSAGPDRTMRTLDDIELPAEEKILYTEVGPTS